jgi:hypothetical protein
MRSLGRAVLVWMALVANTAFAADKAPGEASIEKAMQLPSRIVPRHFLRHSGRRIESGLRVETSEWGVRVSDTLFPAGGEARGMDLPPHLGGGYLFFQPISADGSSATIFYRAQTWTGKLQPLARIPFAVRHVEAGMDRIYALGVSLQAALDAETGQLLPLGPLPPLVTISGMAFSGSRRALVEGPLAGVMYSGDSGLTWARIPGARHIEVDRGGSRLFVRTEEGLVLIDEAGQKVAISATQIDPATLQTTPFERLIAGQVQFGAESDSTEFFPTASDHRTEKERLWVAAIANGALHAGRALAIAEGKLIELSLGDQLELQVKSTPVPTSSKCVATGASQGKSAERGPLFLCQGEHLQVFTLPARDAPQQSLHHKESVRFLWEAPERARLLGYGQGRALISGSCAERRASPESACFVSHGGPQQVILPSGVATGGTPFAVSVTHEEAWVIWVDRKRLRIFAEPLAAKATQSARRKSWQVPEDHSIAEFLKSGALLPQASQGDAGLSIWVTLRDKFVGVQLGDSGEPSFGAVQRSLGRAVFDGPRAAIWGAAGFFKQTVNGGQTYQEATFPYRSGDPELSTVMNPFEAVNMGCSEVGCVLGRLLKVGWRIMGDTEIPLPPARPFLIPGEGRYRYSCSLAQGSRPRGAESGDGFPSFWEEPAPRLPAGVEGSSVGFPDDWARLYAWGPIDTSWGRTGRSQAFFVDPYRPVRVRKTAPTMQLFSSHLDAQDRLGLVDRISSFRYGALDADGSSGVLVLRGRSSTELLVFEEGKPLERFLGATELGLRAIKGVAQTRGTFVAAFHQGTTLSVVRLAGGVAEPFLELPVGDTGERGIQLVRTQAGDLGLFMEGDSALFVYPLSDTGELGEPIVIPHSGAQPPVCAPEALGFIVDRELRVTPYLEGTNGVLLPVNRLRAKLIIGYGRMCVEALRGHARELTTSASPTPVSSGVPLAVINSDAAGRRQEFVCQ